MFPILTNGVSSWALSRGVWTVSHISMDSMALPSLKRALLSIFDPGCKWPVKVFEDIFSATYLVCLLIGSSWWGGGWRGNS